MNTPYNKYKVYSVSQLNSAFMTECSYGNLALVQYLLTSPEIKKHANIRSLNEGGFKLACHFGHLDVVKYLLTSPELKRHSNPRWSESEALRNACIKDQKEVVEYLLTFPKLDVRPDVHAQKDKSFILACDHKSTETLRYLIFEYNIPQTSNIKRYLKAYPNEQVEGWFKMRELNEKLNSELNSVNMVLKPKLKL